jgi:tetratricopeptide (TPR) repeat protein
MTLRGVIVSVVMVVGLAVAPAANAADPAADGAVRIAQRLVQRNPFDARNFYRLGDAYVQKARASGDPTYFTLAEQALGRSLALAPAYADARRHLAFVLYARHDFAGAAREAEAALALNPDDAHALGVLGDARLEVGRYDEAAAAYTRALALSGDLHAHARRAGLRSLRGDVDGAIADLERAVEEGRAAGRPAESVAWVQWQLAAEHFGRGDLAAAEAHHRAALATYPGYYRALAGLAQVRAAQGRYAEAIEQYEKALAVIPMPEYAAALGDVYQRVGRTEDARRQYALVEYIALLNRLNRVLYNRELANFYADHDLKPEEALDLARKEVEARQDIYAHDVLAWALYRNGRHEEAASAIAAALRLGTRDARLLYHAGMIHAARGDRALARRHLAEALALNPRFDVLQADVAARTLDRVAQP